MDMGTLRVKTRSGEEEFFEKNKILNRLKGLSNGLSDKVDVEKIAYGVTEGIFNGIETTEIDKLSGRIASQHSLVHVDYTKLAARIVISDLHKSTHYRFSEFIKLAHSHGLVNDKLLELTLVHSEVLDDAIDNNKDFDTFDYFGISTLINGKYLLNVKSKTIERPQFMFMRVALALHKNDIKRVLETYNLMSDKHFIHATPTLYNAGTNKEQLSSCYLLSLKEDSIDGIYETLKRCAKISKYAGGIGLSVHNVRAKGSEIKGTNGVTEGIIPMLKNFNETAKYVNQGGKRKGSIAIYLEPWHKDIFDFLDLRKNHGHEDMRARDLFYGLWINDLFMERVKEDKEWTLFCPNDTKELYDLHGNHFNKKYIEYEKQKIGKTIKARDLWFKIIEAQIEGGAYYMLYKDACNSKSNQKNLGTIRSSNLCSEIIEYTNENEVAVCNLASICLNSFVKEDGTYDFNKLHKVAKVVTRNLNEVIDMNFYPIEEAEYSNRKHRPIGIGVQGLSDTFMKMRLPFESKEAKQLNKDIFETIYHGALETSVQLAKEHVEEIPENLRPNISDIMGCGDYIGAYQSFKGSPISERKLQFDLWNEKPSKRWDFKKIKDDILIYGLRNSLLTTCMPTASTAQILGNYESIEAPTNNIYVRRVLSGEFVVVNKYLMNDLEKLGLWNEDMKQKMLKENGSIQNIKEIPQELKDLYKTVWEIPQKTIIDYSRDRAPFICQSQSLNIHIEKPTSSIMTSLHFYAWEKGLKTGLYYLRSQPSVQAVKFTVDNSVKEEKKEEEEPNVCISCSA